MNADDVRLPEHFIKRDAFADIRVRVKRPPHDSHSDSLAQLCDFAEFYARRGVDDARKALYRVLEKSPDASAPWLAEEQIVRLEGIKGFLMIAERRGAAIRSGEDVSDLPLLATEVERTHGAEVVENALADAAIHNQDILAYRVRLLAEREEWERALSALPQKRSDRLRAIPVDQVLTAIDVGHPSVRIPDLVGWGRYASENSLREAASRMFKERDPKKIANYLRIFNRAPLPDFDDRMIGLTSHIDSEVRRRAMSALAENRAPAVRALALHRLAAGHADGDTIALLMHNYEPNDYHLLESTLVPSEDVNAMHSLCWGLENVFRENKTPDCVVPMRFAYAHTPCSNCRERFLARLLEFDKAPSEMLEECRFDAKTDIRELVATHPRSGPVT